MTSAQREGRAREGLGRMVLLWMQWTPQKWMHLSQRKHDKTKAAPGAPEEAPTQEEEEEPYWK